MRKMLSLIFQEELILAGALLDLFIILDLLLHH